MTRILTGIDSTDDLYEQLYICIWGVLQGNWEYQNMESGVCNWCIGILYFFSVLNFSLSRDSRAVNRSSFLATAFEIRSDFSNVISA